LPDPENVQTERGGHEHQPSQGYGSTGEHPPSVIAATYGVTGEQEEDYSGLLILLEGGNLLAG